MGHPQGARLLTRRKYFALKTLELFTLYCIAAEEFLNSELKYNLLCLGINFGIEFGDRIYGRKMSLQV